jgi:hypothetical protein
MQCRLLNIVDESDRHGDLLTKSIPEPSSLALLAVRLAVSPDTRKGAYYSADRAASRWDPHNETKVSLILDWSPYGQSDDLGDVIRFVNALLRTIRKTTRATLKQPKSAREPRSMVFLHHHW